MKLKGTLLVGGFAFVMGVFIAAQWANEPQISKDQSELEHLLSEDVSYLNETQP